MGDVTRMTFVLEQHLGHQTYALNLRTAIDDDPSVDARWIPIDYAPTGRWWDQPPVPGHVRSILRCRATIAAGLAANGARRDDGRVFNTQVPAVIGGRRARNRPYVCVTDVTPLQYDAMAAAYGHRPDTGPARWLKHRWNRRVLGRATRCVGWSTFVASSLRDDYGIDPDRIDVVPPGVDTDVWRAAPRTNDGPVRILFVGADFVRKGGPDLLQAFSMLDPSRAVLELVTKTPVERRDGIRVHDDLQPNDPRLIELFATSDVFVLASHAEAFGIAAAEASATGMPVIATRVGGLVDIVDDGNTGFIVEPGAPAELAGHLRRLVDDPELRRRLGAAARDRACRHFDARTNARRLIEIAQASFAG